MRRKSWSGAASIATREIPCTSVCSPVIYSWAILYQSIAVAVYGIVVACCFYSFVVFFEEPILKKRFGTEYVIQYCAEVPRWLFV